MEGAAPRLSLVATAATARMASQTDDVLDVGEFARAAASRFALGAIEVPTSLMSGRAGAGGSGVTLTAVPEGVWLNTLIDDSDLGLSQGGEGALSATVAWIRAARRLGCAHVTVIPSVGGEGYDAVAVARACHACAEEARDAGVRMLLGNQRVAPGCEPDFVDLLRSLDPDVRALVDVSAVPPSSREAALRDLAPVVAAVHATTYDFDEYGEDRRTPIGYCIRRLTRSSGAEWLGIRYAGGEDPDVGIDKSKRLLEGCA